MYHKFIMFDEKITRDKPEYYYRLFFYFVILCVVLETFIFHLSRFSLTKAMIQQRTIIM